MSKKVAKKMVFLAAVFLWSVFALVASKGVPVQAASKGLGAYKVITERKPTKVGKKTFSMIYNSSSRNSAIYVKENGKTRMLVSNCVGSWAITNGQYVYYGTGLYSGIYVGGGYFAYWDRCVRRVDVATGKGEKVYEFYGRDGAYVPVACDGTYLYLGTAIQYTGSYRNFCVLNMNTGKMVNVNDSVSSIQKLNGKLLVIGSTSSHGGSLFIMNKDGSGKKYIRKANVTEAKIKGKYIYFKETKFFPTSQYGWCTRTCKCKLNGKGRKAITGWK